MNLQQHSGSATNYWLPASDLTSVLVPHQENKVNPPIMLWVRVKQENAEPSVLNEISLDYIVTNYSSEMKDFSSYLKGTHKRAEKTLSTRSC